METLEQAADLRAEDGDEVGMTKEEINKIVKECPYADKSIDSMHTCDLEFHYRKICPSPECLCAKRFGLLEPQKDGAE